MCIRDRDEAEAPGSPARRYAYVRDRPMPAARRAGVLAALGNRSLGACAADAACAAANELGRLCSLHTTLLCGEHADCGARARGADGVAGDAAVARAIENLNASRGGLLLAVPVSRLASGLDALETLAPAYLSGLARAAARVSRAGSAAAARGARAYDPAGTNAARADRGEPFASDDERAAAARLCRQDTKVVDFAERLFDARLAACRAQKELRRDAPHVPASPPLPVGRARPR